MASSDRLAQRSEDRLEALDSIDDEVGALDDRGGAFLGLDADANGGVQCPVGDQRVERVEGVEVGDVVAAEQRGAHPRAGGPTRRTALPFPIGTGGRSSSTLRPQWVSRPAACASAAMPSSRVRAASSSGAPRQWNATIGPLSSSRTRSRRRSRRVVCGGEAVDSPGPAREGGYDLGALGAGLEQLGAMAARVGDAADADEPPRLGRRAPGNASDAAVAAAERADQPRASLGDVGVLGAAHDRREGPVDVAKDRGVGWVVGYRAKRLGERFSGASGHGT